MHMLTTRRSVIACLIIAVLAVAALLGVDRFGRESRVLGLYGTIQEPQGIRKIVDQPVDAYRIWKEAGFRGRTLVFVSGNWETFDPGALVPPRMFRAYPLQLFNTAKFFEDEQLNGTTFLYVASLSKVVRRIVAVLPEAEVARMKQMVGKVKDSRANDKGVYLSRQGFPRWFTTAANVASVKEPALLFVGASYFKSVGPEELYRQLRSSGLRSDCVILCKETGKAGVTPEEVAKLVQFAQLIGISTGMKSSGDANGSLTKTPQRTRPVS